MEREGRLLRLGELWITDSGWADLRRRAESVLADYHARFPLRQGPPSEELRQRLGLAAEAYSAAVASAVAQGWLSRTGDFVHLPGHQVRFKSGEEDAAVALLARFRGAPYSPPTAKEARADAGAAVVQALVARGELVDVGSDVLFDRVAYDELRRAVDDTLDHQGRITVADLRDRFGTSRKYALALLEHLDRIRVTRREGDAHVRGATAAARPRPEEGA
jgi:selenocysteine-specific elongation factor